MVKKVLPYKQVKSYKDIIYNNALVGKFMIVNIRINSVGKSELC